MEYKVYARMNDSGCITAVNSSAFLADPTGWTEIDSGTGDKYHHAQGNYFPLPLMTDGGAYRYKLINSKPVECTPEEIQEQEEAKQTEPTPGTDPELAETVSELETALTVLLTGEGT